MEQMHPLTADCWWFLALQRRCLVRGDPRFLAAHLLRQRKSRMQAQTTTGPRTPMAMDLANVTEWLLGSVPTNKNSNLRITSISATNLQFDAKPYELYEFNGPPISATGPA